MEYSFDLSKFKETRSLGHGSFGDVHLYQNENTGEKYAVKKYIRFKTFHEQTKLLKEISLYIQLNHPAILSLVGINLVNQNKIYPLIITEYMENGSLENIINRRNDIPLSKKYIILLGVADGMKYLHLQNIIHLDLKPGNILLDEKLHPHICDFGESKIFEDTEIQVESAGSPAYKSPEIIKCDRYTYKTDVYSFSIVAYELITGISPYPNMDSKKIYKNVKSGQRPDLSSIQEEKIRLFLEKCWAGIPDDRPSFSEIVEEIKKEDFRRAMNVNDDEVIEYIQILNTHQQNQQNLHTGHVVHLAKNICPQDCKAKADQGDPFYMTKYAKMLQIGDGVKVDKIEAIRYYKMAIERGNAYAMNNYASMLYEGDGIEVDKKEAARYYKMAIDRGNDYAMNRYAKMLLNGDGVEVNKSDAIYYFKLSIERGNDYAMYNYANMLYNGDGVELDRKEAARYFKMAADKGNSHAMNRYAKMLEFGDGLELNKSEALRYYKMGAEKGDEFSKRNYNRLIQSLDNKNENNKS